LFAKCVFVFVSVRGNFFDSGKYFAQFYQGFDIVLQSQLIFYSLGTVNPLVFIDKKNICEYDGYGALCLLAAYSFS